MRTVLLLTLLLAVVAPSLAAYRIYTTSCSCTDVGTGFCNKWGCEVYSDPSCFPGSSSVLLESGLTVPIRDLRVGDRVQVSTPSEGEKARFSEVYAFLDAKKDSKISYLDLAHSGNGVLRVTPLHTLFVRRNGHSHFVPMLAHQVTEGDALLFTPNATEATSRSVHITSVSRTVDTDAFAPATMEGTIVVDGVVASCYANTVRHHLAHLSLAPLRALYQVAPQSVQRQSPHNTRNWYADWLHRHFEWAENL